MAAALNGRFRSFMQSLNTKHEPQIRAHLAKVYMILGATAVATAVGAIFEIFRLINLGILAAIASLGLVLGLHFYPDNGKNYIIRLGMLLSFGFCSGQVLGPLLEYLILINPSIIITALITTGIVFASLSLSALLAERGKYLFLGGILLSIINTMAIISVLNMVFQSYFMQISQLYIGVFVMAAFVLFDTQNIIEKCHMGNRDAVQHALDLFFDVISMFRRLLIILTKNEERRNKERR